MPITIPILQKILHMTDVIIRDNYDRALLRAMFSLAFYTFLRIGEVTTASARATSLLKRTDLDLGCAYPINNISIIFKANKHSNGAAPVVIQIARQKDQNVQWLTFWPTWRRGLLHHFPSSCEPMALQLQGHILQLFKAHSFRIGAASWYAQLGYSDQQIRHLGRWKSNAFVKYIRNISVQV
jgi:hypothetical protein